MDGGVRLANEVVHRLTEPMIAARIAAEFVHALLHHAPRAARHKEKAVRLNTETVLQGGGVHFGAPARCIHQTISAGDTEAVSRAGDFRRGFATGAALASCDQDSQMIAVKALRLLQCAASDSRDPGRVPVE